MNLFGMKHRVAPTLSLTDVLDPAVDPGASKVEIRNALPVVAIVDGTPAGLVKGSAEKRAPALLSIHPRHPVDISTKQTPTVPDHNRLIHISGVGADRKARAQPVRATDTMLAH